jgi:Secretion system C-terminal sorting domain
MKSILKNALTALALLWYSTANAAGFTDSVSVGLPTSTGILSFSLKLSQPTPAVGVYQSILLFAAPASKAGQVHTNLSSSAALDFSTSNKTAFVLVTTASDTNFAKLTSSQILADSINAGLKRLGVKSGHPEFANAPLFPTGFAASAGFAMATASAMPSKTIGIGSIRAYRLNPVIGSTISTIPHLVITGEVSGPDVRNNAGVYFSQQIRTNVLARRASSEYIQHAVEMNASQSTLKLKTWTYLFSFIQKATEKRIPAGSNPVAGPVTLNSLTANTGYLGKSEVWNVFKASNYSVSPFSGPLVPAQSYWFMDQAQANSWVDFHVSPFDSAYLNPTPLPAIPYCSGQRPSSINANFKLKSGIVLDPNNFFRIEMSDINGNFDNPVYQARYFGSRTSANLSDSINDAFIPDNISYMNPVPATLNTNRYRFRVVSTKPYYESPNFGETDVKFCGLAGGEPRVYLSTARPFKQFYQRGDTLTLTAYKNPDFPYTPGNNLRIELSGKNNEYTAGFTTTLFSGVPTTFTASSLLDSFIVKVVIPDTLSFGNRYRLKPYIDGVPVTQGRQTSGNGHDITVIPNQNGNVIIINTKPIVNVTQTGASSGGDILFDGGSSITSRGIVWSSSPAPTIALTTKTSDGTGNGSYNSIMSTLTPGVTYYVRAYATNASSTAYGQEVSFTTLQPDQVPVLTTDPVSAITQTSATSGGNITFNGNSEVTARGVCWGTSPSPVYGPNNSTGDGAGTGTFISNMGPFSANTTYYVRAYALNSTGYGYGNEVMFTTSAQQVQLPTVSTLSVNLSNLPCDSAKSGGLVSFDGGAPVTARGVCWSQTSGPTVDLPTKTINGSGNGLFASYLSGLASSTGYFLRAYATNSVGTSYGPEVEFTTCVPVKELHESENNLVLYPNPVADKLYIQSTQILDISNISVLTIDGKKVILPISRDETGRLVLQTKDLHSGVYVVRVKLLGVIRNMKFLH